MYIVGYRQDRETRSKSGNIWKFSRKGRSTSGLISHLKVKHDEYFNFDSYKKSDKCESVCVTSRIQEAKKEIMIKRLFETRWLS